MNNKSMIVNILTLVGFFVVGGLVLSIALGLLGGLITLAVKLLIPVAIAVFLVRLISGPAKRSRRYY